MSRVAIEESAVGLDMAQAANDLHAKELFLIAQSQYKNHVSNDTRRLRARALYVIDKKVINPETQAEEIIEEEVPVDIEIYCYIDDDGSYEGVVRQENNYYFAHNINEVLREVKIVRTVDGARKHAFRMIPKISFEITTDEKERERVGAIIFQLQINEINRELEEVAGGIIKMIIDKIDDQPIYETIVKTTDDKEYLIYADKIKEMELQDDGEYAESILAPGTEQSKSAIESLMQSIKLMQTQSLELDIINCCEAVKEVAIRPQLKPDFITIYEPLAIEDCYEFLVEDVEGNDYLIVDDEQPYILQQVRLDDGSEEKIILNPRDWKNIVTKIREKVTPILMRPEMDAAEVVELNKAEELHHDLINNLLQKLAALKTSVVAFIEDDGEREMLVKTAGSAYSLRQNQIVKIDLGREPLLLTSKKDRFIMADAAAAIDETCAAIEAQSEKIAAFYEEVTAMALNSKFDFIKSHEEDGVTSFVIELDDFYAMNRDIDGRPAIFCQEGDEINLIAPAMIAPFIEEVYARSQPAEV